MDISVTFRNLDPSDNLKEYVKGKLEKVRKYINPPIDAHVVFSVEKFRHRVDITLKADGIKVKGQEESTDDFFSAVDLVCDKIERQVKRYRDKLRKRSTSQRGRILPVSHKVIAVEETAEPAKLSPVKTETIEAKPMDIEEAFMQLENSKKGFFVFINSDTDKLNILYKRRNGEFGLLELEL